MLLLNAKRSIIIIISCFFLCIGLACGHSHDEPDTTVIGGRRFSRIFFTHNKFPILLHQIFWFAGSVELISR